MRFKSRRDLTAFNLSFLDCICCGFGAIILLFVLTMGSARDNLGRLRQKYQAVLQQTEIKLERLKALEAAKLAQSSAQEEVRILTLEKHQGLEATLKLLEAQIERAQAATAELLEAIEKEKAEIAALQKPVDLPQKPTSLAVGVPVESNHLVFIVDTSGSMRHPSTGLILPQVLEKIEEALEVYPSVQGLQVIDASGRYIVSNSSGQWLPDTPQVRRRIATALRHYNTTSVSNPVPGILQALRTFSRPDDPQLKMGVYVFGDEFTGKADKVLTKIDELNPRGPDGNRAVTINAIGFPHLIDLPLGVGATGLKFANLMRELTHQHGGAFIALD